MQRLYGSVYLACLRAARRPVCLKWRAKGERNGRHVSCCETYFSHSEWRAIVRKALLSPHCLSYFMAQFHCDSQLNYHRYLLLPTASVSFYFHITTMHTSLPSPTALHTQSRKIAYQGIEGLAKTLTGKWH